MHPQFRLQLTFVSRLGGSGLLLVRTKEGVSHDVMSAFISNKTYPMHNCNIYNIEEQACSHFSKASPENFPAVIDSNECYSPLQKIE